MDFAAVYKCRKRDDYNPIYRMPMWRLTTVLAILGASWLAWGTFTWAPIQGVIAALIVHRNRSAGLLLLLGKEIWIQEK